MSKPVPREPRSAENAELLVKAGASNFPPHQPIVNRNEELPTMSWNTHNNNLN